LCGFRGSFNSKHSPTFCPPRTSSLPYRCRLAYLSCAPPCVRRAANAPASGRRALSCRAGSRRARAGELPQRPRRHGRGLMPQRRLAQAVRLAGLFGAIAAYRLSRGKSPRPGRTGAGRGCAQGANWKKRRLRVRGSVQGVAASIDRNGEAHAASGRRASCASPRGEAARGPRGTRGSSRGHRVSR